MKDISYNISFAHRLYNTFGQTLREDNNLKSLLYQLDTKIENTQKEAIGVGRECADCAVSGEGTCCGKRTGYKCDSILLLINLLLGKSLPTQALDPHLCYFLTKQGCILRARHVICVNFLCNRLRKNIPHEKLVRLQEVTGKELNTLFILEEYIKKKIALDVPYPKRA